MEAAIINFSYFEELLKFLGDLPIAALDSVFQLLLLLVLYLPLLPLAWVNSGLKDVIGCPRTGDFWVVLSIGGLLFSLEVWPVIGGVVAYTATLGFFEHYLNCWRIEYPYQESLLDRVLILGH